MADKQVRQLLEDVGVLQEQVKNLEVNVDIVNELSYEMKYNNTNEIELPDTFYEKRKEFDASKTRKKLGHIQYLATLRQRMVETCSCGNHRGIEFVNHRGEVVETAVCPKTWWIDLNWMALTSDNRGFSKTTPLTTYLRVFVRK